MIAMGLTLVAVHGVLGDEPFRALGRGTNQHLAQQAAIAWLEKKIKEVVPDSDLVATPGPGNSIVLEGRASSRAAAQRVRELARETGSIWRGELVDKIVVAPQPVRDQIQVDLTILKVSASELKKIDPKLVDRWQQIRSPGAGHAARCFTSENPSEVYNVIDGLRQRGAVKLLAQPRLVTMDERPAAFISGGEQAVPSRSANGEKVIRYVPYGTYMKILPRVLDSGKVFLDVETEISSPDHTVETEYGPIAGRRTRCVHISAELASGVMMGMGGLKDSVVECTERPIPILSTLPFGHFFTIKTYHQDEAEIVVLTTATRIDPEEKCWQLERKPVSNASVTPRAE